MRGLVFDLDFTIIHSWGWYYAAYNVAMQHGCELCFAEFLIQKTTMRNIFGLVSTQLRAQGVDRSEEDLSADCARMLQYLSPIDPWCAEELAIPRRALCELRESGYSLGVVTNRYHDEAMQSLRKLEIEDLFSVVVSRDIAPKPKPAPDGILLTVQRLGFEPHRVAYFGESAGDMLAATEAGVFPVGICNNTFIPELTTPTLWKSGAREVGHLATFVTALLSIR